MLCRSACAILSRPCSILGRRPCTSDVGRTTRLHQTNSSGGTQYALCRSSVLLRVTPLRVALPARCTGSRHLSTAAAAIQPRRDEAITSDTDDILLASRPITLRPYQQECLDAVRAALDRGVSRIGVSSPTGSGKTTIFGELLERIEAPSPRQHQVIILVSSIQLAQQTAAHVLRRFPDLWVEIEQGQKYRASGYADVTVATWQTLVSTEKGGPGNDMEQLRLEKFDPASFKAVIVDEAHHAASRSWRLVLNHFDPRVRVETDGSIRQRTSDTTDASKQCPPIIGFSATFSRHDGLSLGAVFEELVFHKDVLDLIDEQWLSPLRFTSIQAQIPLESVAISGGGAGADFATTSLARVINTPVVNTLIVRSWLSRTQGKPEDPQSTAASATHTARRTRTLVFAVNVQHVHDLTAEFRNAGIDARSLTGSTHVRERRELLTAFDEGQFPVLINCAILTEGADIPSIDCVLLARPTLSRNLFSQMIGRGMRLSPATRKRDCLILDLVGSCSKGLVCTPTLFGLDPGEPLDDTTTEELLARRETQQQQDEADREGGENNRASWMRPHLSQDPLNVRFIDWDSAKALHDAMRAKALFTGGVERFTSNAWIDCGDDIYVIDVPPNRGFVRVERVTGEDAAAHDADVASRNGGECWVAHFTARNADAEEARAAAGGNWARRRGSPFRRPRKILVTETLEQAIHGADTYIATHVMRNSGLMRSLMSRFASWRAAPASTRQRAFVEKRLGLHGNAAGSRSKGDGDTSAAAAAAPRLGGMTKGEASIILTRLTHGAKSRWQQEARRQNRALERAEHTAQRRQRESVAVGKL